MVLTSSFMTEIERQKEYLSRLPQGFDWPLFNTRVALESMRKGGYRTTAAAAREIVDNAIEAGAKRVDVLIHSTREGTAGNVVDSIAFIDDGPGMIRDMARFALTWGGGTHYDDPRFMGRFGFGLPNSSINQTRLVEVYTRIGPDEPIYKAWLDLKQFAEHGIQSVPEPVEASLPPYIADYLPRHGLSFDHGVVVVWQKPDRLSYKRSARLKEHILDDFGVVYRYLLMDATRNLEIFVDSVQVEAVDPLFLSPEARYYEPPIDDVDEPSTGGARKMESVAIPVKFWKDPKTLENKLTVLQDLADVDEDDPDILSYGIIHVTVARFPIGFAREKGVQRDSLPYKRLQIRKPRRGMSFVRSGREIETVDVFPKAASDVGQGLGKWPLLQSYAMYWGIEVRFDPALDDIFCITNDKQSVRPVEDFWRVLSQVGVDDWANRENNWQNVMRSKLRDLETTPSADEEHPSSAEVAAQAADIASSELLEVPDYAKDDAEEALKSKIEERVEVTKESIEEARKAIIKRVRTSRYKIEYEAKPDGPFYEPLWVGTQIVVKINTSHPFYTILYQDLLRLDGVGRVRATIDLLLITLARAELTAMDEDMVEWYSVQRRRRWSPYLEDAIEILVRSLEGKLETEEEIVDENEAGISA